jgi:hypothetical protein
VILTNRGRVVARIAPEPIASTTARQGAPDPFAGLRGTVRMVGSFDALEGAIRSLRREFARSLERRVGKHPRRKKRDA